jgi:hypothetical protein
MVLLETEYIENTIRRCAGMEPEDFRELLNGLLAEIDWEPVPKRTPDEIAAMWEALGSGDTAPEQTEPQQTQDT